MQTPRTNKIQDDNAATNDPTIEERETCFEILRVTRNVIHEVAMAKPAKLATALPPLK